MMIFALAMLASAAEASPECADPQTQSAINICAAEAFDIAEAEMAQQWAETSAHMRAVDDAASKSESGSRPSYFASLLKAQWAWLKYRDAQCRAEGHSFSGGSAESMVVGFCLTSLTRARSLQLKEMTSPVGE